MRSISAKDIESAVAELCVKANLSLPPDVEQALRYWERCRLLSRVQDQPPVYRCASVQQALLMKQSAPQDRPYEEFARALCDLFGSRRQLHGSETVLAYEWVEQQKLAAHLSLSHDGGMALAFCVLERTAT